MVLIFCLKWQLSVFGGIWKTSNWQLLFGKVIKVDVYNISPEFIH